MRLHKLAIGRLVDFDTRIEPTLRTKGPYQVLRVRPAECLRVNARGLRLLQGLAVP